MNGPYWTDLREKRYEAQSGSESPTTKSIPHSPVKTARFDLTGGFSDGDVGLGTTQSGTNPKTSEPRCHKVPPPAMMSVRECDRAGENLDGTGDNALQPDEASRLRRSL